MKILQVNKLYYPWLGGIETVVQNIAEDLNKENDFQVDVLVCQAKGRRKIETINNTKVYRATSWGKKLGMPISWDFFRLFLKIHKEYDVIIIHHPFPLVFLILPFIKDKNIFIWYHSDIVRQKIAKKIFTPFISHGLNKAKKIFVSSNNLINNSSSLKRRKNKCISIPFGVDLNYFTANEEIEQEAEVIKNKYGKPLLLSVGRLVYYKGYQYLIEAMKNVDAHLLIIGQGPLKKELSRAIEENKLNNKISIISPVNDLRPFYLSSDLLVLPSCEKSEAFGLVQIEAMAYSKPIINTSLPTGVPEISMHKENGITVPPKDSKALGEAINTIINNEMLKNRYGQESRKRVETIFNRRIFNDKLTKELNR